MSDILSVQQVADLLQINEYTVRYKARNGIIPGFFRIGRKWRIRRADLEKWIDTQIESEEKGGDQDEK